MKTRFVCLTAAVAMFVCLQFSGALATEGKPTPAQRMTPAPHTLTLTKPNGGETLKNGSTATISWKATVPFKDFDLYLSTDNGTTWQTIAEHVAKDTTKYHWTVKSGEATQCLVKVTGSNVSDMVIEDQSDKAFKIVLDKKAVKKTPVEK